jgi:hypothetical protein
LAISVNCATKVISVPRADLTYVSPGLYELDIEDFRLWLRDWEDSEAGMAMPDTHNRNAPVTLSGTTYAQTFEIINGYTVDFEDTGSPWTCRVVGGNHNVADVKVVDHVSLLIGNSAGLIQVTSGSGLSSEQALQLEALAKIHGLVTGSPLTVTATSRAAGGVTQTISEGGGTVTVTRTA